MRIPGQRVKRTRLVQTDRLIVAVEVEMVIPESDPSEPCLESETVELLRAVHEHAVDGSVRLARGRWSCGVSLRSG